MAAPQVNAPVNNAQQQNDINRAFILARAVPMFQNVFSQSFAPASQNVVNVPVRPVGLTLGFLVVVDGNLNNAGASVANRTYFGASNALTNVTFYDTNNYQRINTTGWHLAMLATAKNGFGFGGFYAPNLPYDIGGNWTVQSFNATVAAAGTQALRHMYWVPLAYSADDLRGALFTNVNNAQAQLQLTINATPGYVAGDRLNAITGGAGTTITWSGTVTINVYQVYLDQLPQVQASDGSMQYPLPMLDLAHMYLLNYTTQTGMTAGNDFPTAYTNGRTFLSTFAVYDNAGVFNVGTDINYWALQAANLTQFFKYPPQVAALMMRQEIMADFPPGCYYFSHRRRPISTDQFGLVELVLNASAVTAGAFIAFGYEQFGIANIVTRSQSLN